MTEKRFIKDSGYLDRYLHSDERFRKEKNWNINLPPIREFKSGECIITNKDDTAYSIDELVNLLNDLSEENEQLKQYKYLIKAVEELLDRPISELISDWSDGVYFTNEEQLKFGKRSCKND